VRRLAFRETEKQRGAKARGRKIRCPRCGWQPSKHDRWTCLCGHVWNTFDTRGVCPGCDAKWKETACPRCHQWSDHEAWYADDDAT
jgi:hypothetical protein